MTLFMCQSDRQQSENMEHAVVFLPIRNVRNVLYEDLCSLIIPPYIELYIHPVYNIHTVYTYAADVQRGVERGQKVLDVM